MNKNYNPAVFIVFLPILFQTSFSYSVKLGEDKFVKAYKVDAAIKVDGKLSEEVWQNVPVTEFTQKDPNEGDPASELTHVWVAYDESAIYVAAKMFDAYPDSIIGLLSRRDYFNESDWFGIFVDPYYDRRSGYYFGVNAAGSVVDGILFNDSWDDDSWNGVWESAAAMDKDGWSVEIRIPFTQLRFNKSSQMKWGVNFYRKIQRRNEESYFVMVPKKEGGFVSHFANLIDLKDIEPKTRLEILPYLVSKAQFLVHEADDPFYKGKQFIEALGADFKLGLGSNLTLDATVNPDFGQVEVDPAVVNLSAFETFYDEKRHFFIEGNNIFLFGYGGSNNNWGFNWGNPIVFYSRRVGRYPHGLIDLDGIVDSPSETRILGAAKVTGKMGDDWSLGIINAVTERTHARIYENGVTRQEEVEPLTNYGVIRAQKEFNSGKHALGFIGTSVTRNIRTDYFRENISDKAFVYGIDGWVTLDNDENYVLTAFLTGSYSHGTKDYLINLQESSLRYFQRPDARFARTDSSLNSLSGYAGRITLNKQKGNFYLNGAFGIVSPGYDNNDAGFQWRADVINTHLVLGYRWFDPDNIFRRKQLYLAHFRNYNYDGNLLDNGFMLFSNFQFLNYYGFVFRAAHNPESYSVRLTRGGPLAKNPSSNFLYFSAYSDSRKAVVVEFYNTTAWDRLGGKYISMGTNVSWKPSSTINVSIGPFYERNFEKLQWVDYFSDPTAVHTYGRRYVFAEMNQETIGGNIRLNWTFSPTLSLQLFLQPLFSVGDYEHFKELAVPGTYKTNEYGKNGSTIEYSAANEEYTVDPDGKGPADLFSFSNPDFNFKSIRGNVVFRWEFLPGSVFFLVWTHDKTNDENPGSLSLLRDFKNLWNSESNNIFLAKLSYWFDL